MLSTTKRKVLEALSKAYPLDLSITEVAKRAKVSKPTASTWLKVLEAEGKIVLSRRVGKAKFYRIKKGDVKT